MKTLVNIDAAIGKKIVAQYHDYSTVVLHLEGDESLMLKAVAEHDDAEIEVTEMKVTSLYAEYAVKMGLATAEELQPELDASEQRARERRRADYERLRAEFETTT